MTSLQRKMAAKAQVARRRGGIRGVYGGVGGGDGCGDGRCWRAMAKRISARACGRLRPTRKARTAKNKELSAKQAATREAMAKARAERIEKIRKANIAEMENARVMAKASAEQAAVEAEKAAVELEEDGRGGGTGEGGGARGGDGQVPCDADDGGAGLRSPVEVSEEQDAEVASQSDDPHYVLIDKAARAEAIEMEELERQMKLADINAERVNDVMEAARAFHESRLALKEGREGECSTACGRAFLEHGRGGGGLGRRLARACNVGDEGARDR